MPMTFDDLIPRLKARLLLPLPGAEAHEPVRAFPVGPLKPNFETALPPRPGSVLILLYPVDEKILIPLTKRNDYAGAHSGQISFPGGKREQGENEVDNALRECFEEIGVPQHLPQVIGRLTDFFVIPSNFIVTPVVAFCNEKPLFIQDHREVARILECDIEMLTRDDALKSKEIIAAGRFNMMAPHFEVEGEVVWGATAMMLNELRVILRDILLSK